MAPEVEAETWEAAEDFSLDKKEAELPQPEASEAGVATAAEAIDPAEEYRLLSEVNFTRGREDKKADAQEAVLDIARNTMHPAARLFYGVYLGSSGVIEAALAQGINVNAKATAEVIEGLDTVASISPNLPAVQCELGDTALHVALRQTHTGIARHLLCCHRARIDITNVRGEKALDMCSPEVKDIIMEERESLGISADKEAEQDMQDVADTTNPAETIGKVDLHSIISV